MFRYSIRQLLAVKAFFTQHPEGIIRLNEV